jgi:riboflavin kinase/FMN adenylyltransferase
MDHIITGKVVRGDGYGRKIGFPTVNLEIDKKVKIPPEGIYCGDAILEGKKYRAGIVIGPGEKVEGYLIGYDGDAYGKEVTLEIRKFIRQYKKFDTEAELIAQIKEDLKKC